jgi:hypothetical protein
MKQRLLMGLGIGLIGGLIAVLPFAVSMISLALFGLLFLGLIAYRSARR